MYIKFSHGLLSWSAPTTGKRGMWNWLVNLKQAILQAILCADITEVFLTKILAKKQATSYMWSHRLNNLLFMCTLDHLGKWDHHQQCHHLWPQQEAYIKQATPCRITAAAGSMSPFRKRGKASLEHRERSLKMSDTEVLCASIPFPHLHKPTPGIWDIGPLSEQCGRSLSADRVF